MSYLKNGTEYLTHDEMQVMIAVRALTADRRTGNNMQISRIVHFSPSKVGKITTGLRMRGYLKDVSKGAAYHWRVTGKKEIAEGPRDLSAMFPIG